MKSQIITTCICLLFLNSINTQVISYKLPRDTSKFLGQVKSSFLFEYHINSFDTTKLDNSMTEGLPPSYSYHFNKDKLMTHMLSYQGGSVFTVTHFLYDQDNNLIFKIRGKPNKDIHIEEGSFWTGAKTPDGNTAFDMTYTYFDDHNIIIKTDGAEITRYHYDMANLTMLINSGLRKPSSKLLFDNKGRIIEIESYSYEKGILKLRKEEKTYKEGLLVEEKRNFGGRVITKSFTYDNNGRIITEKTVRTDSVHNRTSHYRYISDNIVETKVYNDKGDLISTVVETSNESEVRKKNQSFSEGDDFLLYSEIVEFKDKVGNVIKRYKIDAQKQYAIVAEYHFTYY